MARRGSRRPVKQFWVDEGGRLHVASSFDEVLRRVYQADIKELLGGPAKRPA